MDRDCKWLRTVLLLPLCLFFFFQAVPLEPAVLPPANREEAEKFFGSAYGKYCTRDYYGALEDLDRALKLNTFLVDFYLMRGLALHRTGRADDALKSLKYFLEVRPRDTAVPRILSRFEEEGRFLGDVLAGRPVFSRTASSMRDLRTALGLPVLQNLGIKGLGKAESSPSGGLAVADTLGGRLWMRNRGERSFSGIDLESPVTALFSGQTSGIVLLESGKVLSFGDGGKELTELGELPFPPSDGALISEGAFAAVSASYRRAGIFSLPDLSLVSELTFPETEHPFEPAAAATFGEWLAVADRNNSLVFIVSLRERRTEFSFGADSPRDLAWSPFGDLFVVHEKGEVSKTTISFETMEAVRSETVIREAPGAWSLFSLEDRVYCLDVAGFSLWEMYLFPEESSPAFLSLDTPSVLREEDRESFLLGASISGPYRTYMSRNRPVVTSVWNERMLTADFRFLPEKAADPAVFFVPPGSRAGGRFHEAATGKEVLQILGQLWTDKRNRLTDVAAASSIPFSPGELKQLAGFCLQNGIRLFAFCDTVSPMPLVRASGLTGGTTLFSPQGDLPGYSSSYRGEVRISLPSDETSSGFPSRSVLSVYMDVGSASSRDWMPLWPDLL
ncbi:hypothetical protein C8D99_1085 [Aminivibrio pyruvatiphilus]|uniref:Uncharacterized protein n=1 Tax=Aminivibrio pyruvatiphilus TaxID=1005740 RepID=A0A4R8M9G3_9BACT|nr:tetratricopeptide repeat protein [Aminivibrio pyruvatiphilus]TDY60465.1 hypothetical protein C8D99_1085 [Aminivibrio pyruvatiphilus]